MQLRKPESELDGINSSSNKRKWGGTSAGRDDNYYWKTTYHAKRYFLSGMWRSGRIASLPK